MRLAFFRCFTLPGLLWFPLLLALCCALRSEADSGDDNWQNVRVHSQVARSGEKTVEPSVVAAYATNKNSGSGCWALVIWRLERKDLPWGLALLKLNKKTDLGPDYIRTYIQGNLDSSLTDTPENNMEMMFCQNPKPAKTGAPAPRGTPDACYPPSYSWQPMYAGYARWQEAASVIRAVNAYDVYWLVQWIANLKSSELEVKVTEKVTEKATGKNAESINETPILDSLVFSLREAGTASKTLLNEFR